MKKLLTILVLLCAATASKGQYMFQLGLKAHPLIGWISPNSEQLSSDGSKIGFSYGLMGDFHISERYSFNTGLELTSSGGKNTERTWHADGTLGSEIMSDYNLQYLEVPLNVRLKTNPQGPWRFYGLFGLVPGINIKARADRTTRSPDGVQEDQTKVDVSDGIQTFKIGLAIGGGTMYELGSGDSYLLTGLTFHNGFTNIYTGNERANLSYIALNIGVFF